MKSRAETQRKPGKNMEKVRRRRPAESEQGIILRIFNDKVGSKPDGPKIPHNWQGSEKFFVYYLQSFDEEKKNQLGGFTAADCAALVEFWVRERKSYIQQSGLEFEHRAASMLNRLDPSCTRHFAPWQVNLQLGILFEAHRDELINAIPNGHPISADFREVPANMDHTVFARFHSVYGYLGFQKTGTLLMNGEARKREIKLGSDMWQSQKCWFATIRLKIQPSGHATMPLVVPILALEDFLESAQLLPAFGTVEDLTLLEYWHNQLKEKQPSTNLELEQRAAARLNAVASQRGHESHRSYKAKHVHLRLQFLLREYQQVLTAQGDKPLSISRTTFTHFGSVYRFLGGQKVVMEASKWSETTSTWNKISPSVWQIPSIKTYEPWGLEYPYESDSDSPDTATLRSAASRKDGPKGPRRTTKSSGAAKDVIVAADEQGTEGNDCNKSSAAQRAQEGADGVPGPAMQVSKPGANSSQTEKITPLHATTAKPDVGRDKRPRSPDENDGAELCFNLKKDAAIESDGSEENKRLMVKVRRVELQVRLAEAEDRKLELEEENKRRKERWEANKRKNLRVELRESAETLYAAGMRMHAEEVMKKFIDLADKECSSL